MIKHLLIVQNYNANKGDNSVIASMLETFEKKRNEIDVILTSYNPEQAENEYGIPAAEFLVNGRYIKQSRGIKRLWYVIREALFCIYLPVWMVFVKLGCSLPVPVFKKKTIDFYNTADVVVLPGGHFFTSLNGMFTNISHFTAMLLALALGKKTMIYAQTIGPFFGVKGKFISLISRWLFRKINIITVREEHSLNSLSEYENVFQTAEIVFATEMPEIDLNNVPLLTEIRKLDRKLVGVTIHHIYYKYFFAKEEYMSLMADLFRAIIDQYDVTILIIPMEDSIHNGGDRPLARDMIAAANRTGRIFLQEDDLASSQTAALIGAVDLLVGTKTHSVVYGLKSSVPTLAIAYQQKTTEFMKMFGLEKNTLDLKGLTLEHFMAIFDEIFGKLDYYRKLQTERFQKVKAVAMKNNAYLWELLSLDLE